MPQLQNLLETNYFDGEKFIVPLINLCLCNLFLAIGFNASNNRTLHKYTVVKFTNSKWFRIVISIFFIIGAIATLMNRGVYKGGFVSGTFVIIQFFASFATVALLLILIGYKNGILRGHLFVFIAIIIVVLTIDKIIASGRRGATINLVLMVLYFFLNRDKRIYKYLKYCVPGFFFAGMFFGSQIQAYRDNAYAGEKSFIENIQSLDYSKSKKTVLNKGEIYNAFEGMQMVDFYGCYDYGAFNWNGIVKDFVPTALVSRDLKKSMMIENESNDLVSHLTKSGSTMTGYFDSFRSFGLFGFIKFLVIGFIMGFLWKRREASDISLLTYFMLLTPGLHLLTHSSNYFVSNYVFLLIFIYPVLMSLCDRKVVALK